MTKMKKVLSLIVFLVILAGGLLASLWLTQYVTNDDISQKLIREFGHVGILIISFIAGLNALVPVPAATFVPIFTAGGISLPVIIILLVIGTMAANIVSYAIGRYGGKITQSHYPDVQKKLLNAYTGKERWLPYFVFFFTALIPVPDEVFLIPLGVMGIKLKQIIIPLFLGTIFYQTLAAFGVYNVFKFILL
jgi:membrane protein YqaA with SNARE-associated domain